MCLEAFFSGADSEVRVKLLYMEKCCIVIHCETYLGSTEKIGKQAQHKSIY